MATSVDAIHKSSDQINPDQMYVKNKSEYNVKIASDKSQHCYISGICILPSGEAIVADYTNKRVKMLDKHYNVSSDLEVGSNPQDICIISTANQVAITFENSVQFIYVSNGKLVSGEKLLIMRQSTNSWTTQFPHATLGILYHQGEFYVTSGTALYHYTIVRIIYLEFKKTLHEDTGGGITVDKCAVSPDGNLIYVTNHNHHKLITMAIDGTLLSTFTDPDMKGPKGVHVTPTGQVLVCGISSYTVIQVDCRGRKKLATLASEKDGINFPGSICYNTNSCQIIVGAYASNTISVMDLQ